MQSISEQLAACQSVKKAFQANAGKVKITAQQAATSSARRPVPESVWQAGVDLAPPVPNSTDVRQHFLEALTAFGSGAEAFALPKYGPMSGEWVGSRRRRATSDGDNSPSTMTEQQKYDALWADCTSETTILYVHGGAYFFGSPITARSTTIPLSSMTGGRSFAVKYRLAPQHVAPAQQLDVFMAYLSLLYPSEGSLHKSIPASSIVLAGDSCGASIIFSVVQIILQLRRQQNTSAPTVLYDKRQVQVPMPAGVSSLSCAADMLLCLPSYHHKDNIAYDMMSSIPPYRGPTGKCDSVWPSTPPRAEICCEASAMAHPLFNPSVFRDWKGAPPMYLAAGQERFADASRLIAQNAARQGVSVQYWEYAFMPHIFAANVKKIPQSKHCLAAWAAFCARVGRGEVIEPLAAIVEAGELKMRPLDVRSLVDYSLDDAIKLMEAKRGTMLPWCGPSGPAQASI